MREIGITHQNVARHCTCFVALRERERERERERNKNERMIKIIEQRGIN